MIILALGAQGSGKTHSAVVEVRRLLAARRKAGLRPLLAVHDLRSYYAAGGPRPRNARRAGGGAWVDGRSAGALVPAGCWYPDPEAWWHRWERDHRVRAARVVGFHSCPIEAVWEVAAAHYRHREPMVVFSDELDTAAKQLQSAKSAGYMVCHYGRKIPIDVVGTARRPQNLDLGWLSEASVVLLHQIHEAAARDVVRRSGWPGAEHIAARLSTLKPRQRYRLEVRPDIIT